MVDVTRFYNTLSHQQQGKDRLFMRVIGQHNIVLDIDDTDESYSEFRRSPSISGSDRTTLAKQDRSRRAHHCSDFYPDCTVCAAAQSAQCG
jgi:hypothetical protein